MMGCASEREKMKKKEFKKAVTIGTACIISYLASYFMRNVLSVSTPQMIENDGFTKATLGLLSSAYFFVYAFGQLINGWIGDRVKGKYMVGLGLVLSGIFFLIFPFTNNKYMQILCFGVSGFGLSMLRGPLVRIISENTLPRYARNCCVGFSVASFCGPLLAGLIAAILSWKFIFIIAALIAIFMGIGSFLIFTLFEQKGLIIENKSPEVKVQKRGGYLRLFYLDKFVLFLLVGALTETVGASIVFWIPTYISEGLGFSPAAASTIYSIISVVKAFSPFVCIFIFEKLHENDMLVMKIMFIAAAIAFAAMNLLNNAWMDIFVLLVALMAAGCVSAILWSVYIPSLSESGCVSSANGFLDFFGYIVASIANIVFAKAVSQIGWKGLIFVWSLLMLFGGIVVSIYHNFSKKEKGSIV